MILQSCRRNIRTAQRSLTCSIASGSPCPSHVPTGVNLSALCSYLPRDGMDTARTCVGAVLTILQAVPTTQTCQLRARCPVADGRQRCSYDMSAPRGPSYSPRPAFMSAEMWKLRGFIGCVLRPGRCPAHALTWHDTGSSPAAPSHSDLSCAGPGCARGSHRQEFAHNNVSFF